MAQQRAAVHRALAASREGTPTHSRAASLCASSEAINSDSATDRPIINHVLDNDASVMVNGNRISEFLAPSQDDRPEGRRGWYGSSTNLTSSDSTPSSDNTTDSGQATDSSPLAGPLAALGLSQGNESTNTCLYRMPIVGYEVLEERNRFTVFKIQVFHQPSGDQWFVFRRYTDFVRLNKRLREEFPGLRFALPPKRWFGDNFDPIFLEDRQLGLQAFIDNIIGRSFTPGQKSTGGHSHNQPQGICHTRIREKKCVRDFFCLDNPPGPHDTLEESRAICQTLEDTVSEFQEQLRERDGEIAVLRSQVNFLMAQQQTLVKALRLECELQGSEDNKRGSTHDLNVALLNMNGVNQSSGDSTPVRQSRPSSTVNSPLRRTLEKAFLSCSDSHVAIQSNSQVTGAVNTHNSVEVHAEEANER
ncbi:uncharacterized protein LOC121863454 isoform X2 [Homarus americanus]|uniref:uncharacterized protein LOC121863454 isoform X2 n=1 Tax=Homarus americanus TaxID=6706 RepID=UPI001C472CB3|nr:uncharacterized protein LOC121863454 isoform X2 [Homarus americanus]